MKLYSTNQRAVDAAVRLLSTYENLCPLIDNDDLSTFWLDYLDNRSLDANDLLVSKRVLTVFTISIVVSYVQKQRISNEFTAAYEGMLGSLDRAVGILGGSRNLECFRAKLRNPEGTQTISSFSELFLAEHFFKKGFNVEFEFPFQLVYKNNNVANRDFDIATSLNGQSFLVEVYTPVSSIHGGEIGIAGESYSDFMERIKHKAADKFGFGTEALIRAPNFPKVLAVNARYYDSVSFELVLGLSTHKLAGDLRSMFTEKFPVDAIIIFQINDTHPTMPIQFHLIEPMERKSIFGS